MLSSVLPKPRGGKIYVKAWCAKKFGNSNRDYQTNRKQNEEELNRLNNTNQGSFPEFHMITGFFATARTRHNRSHATNRGQVGHVHPCVSRHSMHKTNTQKTNHQ